MVCCSLMPTLNSTGNTLRGFPSLISSGKIWNTSRGNGTCTVKWSLNVGKGKRNRVQQVFPSRASWTTWYSREDEPDASLQQILLGKRYFSRRICFSGLSELWHQHTKFTHHFTPRVLVEISHLLRWCSSTVMTWGRMALSQSYKCWHAGTTLLFFLSNSYIPFYKATLTRHFTLWFPVAFLGGG